MISETIQQNNLAWMPTMENDFRDRIEEQMQPEFLLFAATAKLFQSCPTLCNPIDGSPPGSPIPGILQARTLEWVAISFSNAWKWKVKVKSLSRVWLLAIPWTEAYQAPLSMEFSREEYWSGLPLPSPFDSLVVAKIVSHMGSTILHHYQQCTSAFLYTTFFFFFFKLLEIWTFGIWSESNGMSPEATLLTIRLFHLWRIFMRCLLFFSVLGIQKRVKRINSWFARIHVLRRIVVINKWQNRYAGSGGGKCVRTEQAEKGRRVSILDGSPREDLFGKVAFWQSTEWVWMRAILVGGRTFWAENMTCANALSWEPTKSTGGKFKFTRLMMLENDWQTLKNWGGKGGLGNNGMEPGRARSGLEFLSKWNE